MSKTNFNNEEATAEIFSDPVAYLAGFGIDSEIAPDEAATQSSMPAAA